MSYADTVFVRNCVDILMSGVSDKDFEVRTKWKDGTPAHTYKKLYTMDYYPLTKHYIPMITLRKGGIKNAVDEILWIYQKKTSDLSQLNSHIWDSWNVGDGTIGKAYGYQIGKKSKYKNPDGTVSMRDQIDQVIWDLKNNPGSRSIITNTYCHEDLSEMGLRPCAYSMTFNVTKDTEGNMYLNGMLNQRSQDMLTANNWNVVQYSILLHMLAQVCNMKVGMFTHVVADMHIYDRHIPIIMDMLRYYYDMLYSASSDNAKTLLKDYISKFEENIHACLPNYPEELTGDDAVLLMKLNVLLKHSTEFDKLNGLISHPISCNFDVCNIKPFPNPVFSINENIKDFYDFTVDDVKLVKFECRDYSPKFEVAI